mgnify:CR=1 FL=1
MKHLHNYESLNESKDMDTIKKQVLDFAEKNGKSKWGGKDTKLGRDANSHGLLMRPTKQDPRYLEKNGKDYIVKVWDGKSKLA